MLKKYRDEIDAKNDIIMNLESINDNLIEKLKYL